MTRAARRPGGLALVGALTAVGAALTAFAATRIWWTATFTNTPVGSLVSTATGSETVPELVAVALIALAGFGAALATRGGWRRGVGGLILAAGLLVVVRALVGLVSPPREVLGRTPFVVGADVTPAVHPAPVVTAVIGGLLIAAAGALLLAGAGADRRMSGRYERTSAAGGTTASGAPASGAPASGAPAAGATASGARSWGATTPRDPVDVQADLWRSLDAGVDPTVPENDTGENDTGENDTGENDTGENDTAENDTAENDTAENDTAENDTAENDTAENDTAENDTAEDEKGSVPPTTGETPDKYPAAVPLTPSDRPPAAR